MRPFIQISHNPKRLIAALERIAAALERAFPEEVASPPVTLEEGDLHRGAPAAENERLRELFARYVKTGSDSAAEDFMRDWDPEDSPQ